MLELQILNRSGDMIKAYALGDRDELIVGRDESCDIRIKARSVSREHCSIEQDGQEVLLRDLDSTGGTFLDGERVESVRIENGMEFTIGPATLRFLDSGL